MRMRGLSAHTRGHFKRDGNAKLAYLTRADAEREAQRTHMVVYRCKFCGQWHVGNSK